MADIFYNNQFRKINPVKVQSRHKEDDSKLNAMASTNRKSDNTNNAQQFSCANNFFDFCSTTSLHGLKFVGDKKLSHCERVFFVIAFLTAFGMAIQFVFNVYEKWLSTPVIIGLSASATYINKIPFPAVTICNMNQAQASKVKYLNTKTVEYSILQTLCSREADFQDEELNSTKDWAIYEKFIVKVAQPCHKMLISCQFGSLEENCSEIFRTVITDEGLCCAFNTVDPRFMYKRNQTIYFASYDPPKDYVALNWTPEKGYPKNLPPLHYPRSAKGVGCNMGLSVVLDAQLDEYHCSSTNGPGFKILLHNPIEAPNVGSSGISAQIGYETRLVINPHINVASTALKSMKKQQRQCLFEDESNLTFYATYSRRNCELECESRILAKECNCVHFFMPRIPPNISICGLGDAACFDYASTKAQILDENEENDCNKKCSNGCFDLTFSPDAYAAPIGYKNFTIKDQMIQDMPMEYVTNNIAVLHFYYVEKAFRANIKEQFIGLTEFLSNTGGIIGLFLGFSVISFIEVVYFATIRPICICKRIQDEIQNNANNAQRIETNSIPTICGRNYNRNLNIQHDELINNIWRKRKNKNKIKGQMPIFRRKFSGLLPYTE